MYSQREREGKGDERGRESVQSNAEGRELRAERKRVSGERKQ